MRKRSKTPTRIKKIQKINNAFITFILSALIGYMIFKFLSNININDFS